MSLLKKYWPHIVAVLAVCEPFLEPSLKVYIAAHPHAALGILLGAALAMYHKTAPGDQPGPNQQNQQSDNGNKLACLLIVAMLCLCSIPSRAQTAATPAPLSNIYAGGISFNSSGSPAIAGTGLYARLVSPSSGTYAFTAVDALPASVKPFTVTSSFSAGVAQKVFSIGSIPIFVPTAAGVSYNGTNTGWAWSTGGLASIKLKGNWKLFPTVRIAKSSVSAGSGYQPIVGLLVGWGN